ncbi:KR domain-containing protein [Saccharopolyspora sp. K220]|uniref:KR domain-containing protein n=1 Tax=Saccharopolyspora soli TaxID=2926618 RepID=UPI001F5A642A|nr:KR domain-containing protein [Saccharopolyspora soli]MCI2416127.1 KR domain-containing protein [Saccharopolyspora soli]
MIAGSSSAFADALAARLRDAGWVVLDESAPRDAESLDLVLWLADDAPADWDSAAGSLRDALLLAGGVQRGLERTAASTRAAFVAVTRMDGLLGFSGVALETAVTGGLPGLVKTLAAEAPAVFCRAVDLHPDLTVQQCAEALLAEVHDSAGGSQQVGYDAEGIRRTVVPGSEPGVDPELPACAPNAVPGPDDLLVVSGGGRGVTAECAVGLARRFRTGLLLLGRTPLEDEPTWANDVVEPQLKAAIAAQLKENGGKPTPRDVEPVYRNLVAQREIRRTLGAIREAGAFVEYLAVDVADRDAVRTALGEYRDRITGVVHGAGALSDRLLVDKTAADVDAVFAPKLFGLRSLLEAVDHDRIRYVLLYSSVAGFFGNRGQADYAMANESLNRLACTLSRHLPGAKVASLNWGPWAGGMVTPELARMFRERGVEPIPVDAGVQFVVEHFASDQPTAVVSVVAT